MVLIFGKYTVERNNNGTFKKWKVPDMPNIEMVVKNER